MNFNHLDFGTGPVGPAIDYVFQEKDHNGVVRTDVQVLAGNAAELRRICDAIQHKQKYKSAVISFTPGDNPTRSDLDAVIADFEKVAFSGLEKATYCYLAVLHIEHDGSQHLHIISACIHLATGKAYNPAAPGWEGDYGPMRNYWNWKMGWARPDDPRRARVVYGKNLQKTLKWKQGMDRRQQIAQALSQGVVDGKITSRDDVVADLKAIGSVTKESKNSISLVMAGATSPIRLSGPVFSKNWNAEAVKQAYLVDRDALYFTRETPDPERAERWLALMNERIVLKAEYNKNKFSSIGRGSRKIEIQTEEGVTDGSDTGRTFQQLDGRNRSRDGAPSRAPDPGLRAEFDINRVPAIAGFAGETGAQVVSLAAVGKIGSINAFNDVQRLQRSGLDDAKWKSAGILQSNESDYLEQRRPDRNRRLRWPINDGRGVGDAQRTSSTWRQDEARELAFRAIGRANQSSKPSASAAAGQADEADQEISRAFDAAERAAQSLERTGEQARSSHDAVNELLRETAKRIAAAFAGCAQIVKDHIQNLARTVTAPRLAANVSSAALAYAAADKALKDAREFERAKAAVREHRLGRGKPPTPDQVKLVQQPAAKKTIKQLVDLREAAANRLDIENGTSFVEKWDQEIE